jgi:hypothetical protein
MPDKQQLIESPESSSPIVTRAVAAGLSGRLYEPYQFSAVQKLVLQLLGLLPQSAACLAISNFQRISGIHPDHLADFSIEELAASRLKDYADLPGSFPAVTVGAALGGASAQLALSLGGPFLPQAFVTTLKGGAPDGSVSTYLKRSEGLALESAARNPGTLTIQHFDPAHDGYLTRYVNHLRFKLINLPDIYARYIRQNLSPGGVVCYLDCGARWLRYRIGERSVFQVGGWGGIPDWEFLQGSERLNQYRRQSGQTAGHWRLEGYPLETGPESEWGSEPGLYEALQKFCNEYGYRFVPISLPEPHDYSILAFRAVKAQLRKQDHEPAGVLIQMFTQFDTSAVLHTGLLPLWLVFNTGDSLNFLQKMLPSFPAKKPVFFSPLATFSLTPDLVPWEQWEAALKGTQWYNAGARPSHYPADTWALTGWSDGIRKWARKYPQPVTCRLSIDELTSLILDAGFQS